MMAFISYFYVCGVCVYENFFIYASIYPPNERSSMASEKGCCLLCVDLLGSLPLPLKEEFGSIPLRKILHRCPRACNITHQCLCSIRFLQKKSPTISRIYLFYSCKHAQVKWHFSKERGFCCFHLVVFYHI